MTEYILTRLPNLTHNRIASNIQPKNAGSLREKERFIVYHIPIDSQMSGELL
jgi:hypothetical protein